MIHQAEGWHCPLPVFGETIPLGVQLQTDPSESLQGRPGSNTPVIGIIPTLLTPPEVCAGEHISIVFVFTLPLFLLRPLSSPAWAAPPPLNLHGGLTKWSICIGGGQYLASCMMSNRKIGVSFDIAGAHLQCMNIGLSDTLGRLHTATLTLKKDHIALFIKECTRPSTPECSVHVLSLLCKDIAWGGMTIMCVWVFLFIF